MAQMRAPSRWATTSSPVTGYGLCKGLSVHTPTASAAPHEHQAACRQRHAVMRARRDGRHPRGAKALNDRGRTLRWAAVLPVPQGAVDAHTPRAYNASLAQAEAMLIAARHGHDGVVARQLASQDGHQAQAALQPVVVGLMRRAPAVAKLDATVSRRTA